MPAYEINSFRGGLSDYEDKGIPGSFKFGSNLDIRKDVDSLTCQQALEDEGLVASHSPSLSASPSASFSASPSISASASASPTPSPSSSVSKSPSATPSLSVSPSASVSPSISPSAALTSVFRDLIRFFVKANDGYTYGFGSTGYVYRRDADAFWQVMYKDADGAIKGAWEWYSDTGATYLYFATNTKLKRKILPGLANWNDVQEVGTLDPADWHTMRDAGGSLIIANGPKLALVGYDNSFTDEALDLIPGNIARTIVERNGRTIVGTARKGDLTRGINAAIDTEVPLAQVGDEGELFFANGSDSVPVKTFPGGGKVNPGGVTNEVDQVNFFEWEQNALSWIDKQSVGNMALFAVYGADTGKNGIYSYGRTNKNKPFVMNLDYALEADELGALVSVDGTILVSYQDGSEFGVKAVDPDTKATGTYESLDLKTKMKKPVDITEWPYVEIYCKPLPDFTSIEFQYKLNKSGDFIAAKMEDGSTQFRARDETKAVFLVASPADIFEARVILNPYGNITPEVMRIRPYFE